MPDSELLKLRFKDLKVTIVGTWLERCLKDLHDELAERGLRIRPHAWMSNEWFSPDDTPGIAIPFYLAHPRLMRLERKRMTHDIIGQIRPVAATSIICRCGTHRATRTRISPRPLRCG